MTLPRAVRACLWSALVAVTLVALANVGPRQTATAQGDLIAYTMVDQWPERQQAATGLFQNPADLDVMADGRIFIADPGIGGVHLLLPSGEFATPFGVTGGYPAQLGRVGQVAVGPVPGGGADEERAYVLDTSSNRVVIYDRDGQYLAAWEKVNGQGIAASSDGRVYVLDRDTSQVRALDAATGATRFAVGSRGTDDGQFTSFSDISVAPDGRVMAVTDKMGRRVQLFDLVADADLAADPTRAPASLRRVYDLMDARYTKGDNTCRGERVNALGDDKVFVGAGNTACLINKTAASFAIAASAGNKTICRDTVRLPAIRSDLGFYFALATYNPNTGACGDKRTELATSPAIVRYDDEQLRTLRTMWKASSDAKASNPELFAPSKLSMPAADRMFVVDSSPKYHYYTLDGTTLGSVARDSARRDDNTATEFYMLTNADGTDKFDEVYATYFRIVRSGTRPTFEAGIGRFRNATKVTASGTVEVVEPVWTSPIVNATGGSGGSGGPPRGGRPRVDIGAIAFNATSGELLAVRNETSDQTRSLDMKLARYAPDGTRLAPTWDLPDDGKVNPYADLSVGPDGRIFLLDDLGDKVVILDADGTPAGEVSVVFDARSVAGGPASPDGSVFALREAGAIERYADDGTITARLDGRPLAHSDPTTLTDLVVDAAGRVYVADGQSSLISVFVPTEDGTILPVPDDGTCLFRTGKMASPTTLDLGASTTVSLALDGNCAVSEEPADIVVVVPYYGKLQQGTDPSSGTATTLLQMAARINFTRHRMGLVSYYNTNTVELALTSDHDAYNTAVRNITRFDPPNQDVKARLRDAIEAASELFDNGSTRRKVMVLVDPDYCDPANEFRPGQCTGYVSADEAAATIRASGVTIIVSGGFDAMSLASSDEDMIRPDGDIHRRMVRYRLPEVLASTMAVTDTVPANMTLDPATISGGATWNPPSVDWTAASVDFAGARLSYALTPTQAGRWPTNVSAVADVVDGWGAVHHLTFPVPEVEVIGPTPTPAPPTATLLPTATATTVPTEIPPTATSKPSTVYLPLLWKGVCVPDKVKVDVAIVVDASVSMTGAKMTAARADAARLLDAMALASGDDRAAIVTFAYEVRSVQGLTSDRALLDAALAGVTHTAGTRLDRGLNAALDLLPGTGPQPGSGQIIVVLSDGNQTDELPAAGAAVARARARGVPVFVFGLGSDVNTVLLRSLTTDASHYLFAPDSQQVAEVYARTAASVSRCP
jgi:outer membrane protein assembly factor BamB/uncharacterized protein YegL